MAPHSPTVPPQIQLKMNAYYDITYDVAKRVNPGIEDLVSCSTVHTLNTSRHILHEDGRLLFLLPHHEGVFWTNIKYACHGADQPLLIGIVATTEEGECVDILPSEPRPAVTWLDTNWPIPSPSNQQRLYLTVQPPEPSTDLQYLRIKILGFTDLFPQNHSYALVDANKRTVLTFSAGEGSFYPIRRIQDYGPSASAAV